MTGPTGEGPIRTTRPEPAAKGRPSAAVRNLDAELGRAHELLDATEKERDKARAELVLCRQDYGRLTVERDGLKGDLEQKTRQCDDLGADLAVATEEREAVESRMASAERALQDSRAENAALAAAHANVTAERDKAMTDLADAERNVASLTHVQSDNAALRTKLAEAKGVAAGHAEEIGRRDRDRAALQAHVADEQRKADREQRKTAADVTSRTFRKSRARERHAEARGRYQALSEIAKVAGRTALTSEEDEHASREDD